MSRNETDPLLPEVFDQAVELAPSERRALLENLQGREAALAAQLACLLEQHENPASPLDISPWRHLQHQEMGEQEATTGAVAHPAEIAGYRILRELGRGGMGRVYLAEEVTEAFRRAVALKVIDRPSLDADSARRFRDEVRILASLEHPCIARFLDGGRAADGTLYLTLEYVEGEDLRSYAEGRELPLRERLHLFLAALEAVGYAHQRGVVHRDLKPHHLLIGNDGRPRLLDFGISKLITAGTDPEQSSTRTGSRVLTPAYASPEQFRGEPASPASDVYSLGVILYELLVGRRPFSELCSGPALERAVLEVDPEPPSTAARRLAAARVAAPAGRERPLRLGRRAGLEGDLDAICLKALRKLPADRYANAGELANDLRRYLDGLPVEARRGGLRYRLGRAIRRNRTRVVTAVAVAAACVCLAVAWNAHRQVIELRPPTPPPLPFPYTNVGTVTLGELEQRWHQQPGSTEAGCAVVLGLVHAGRLDEAKLMMARVRQIPGGTEDPLADYVEGRVAHDLGEPQRALVLYSQALTRALAAGRGDLLGQVRASRGRLLSTLGRREEGLRELEAAVSELEAAGDHAALSGALNDLAIERLQKGAHDEGSALLQRAVEEGRRGGASVRAPLLNLGIHESLLGRPDRAVGPLESLVAVQRKEGNAANLGQALGVLAHVYHALGRVDDAEQAYLEGIELLRQGSEPFRLRSALEARSIMDIDTGRFDRALETIGDLEARASKDGDLNAMAWVSRLRALCAAATGDLALVRRESERARALLIENDDHDQAAKVDISEALAELEVGDTMRAQQLITQARARLRDDSTSEAAILATILGARIDAEMGRFDAARAALAGVAAAGESASLVRRIQYHAARASLAHAEGRIPDAARDLEAALATAQSARRVGDIRQLETQRAALSMPAPSIAATVASSPLH